MQINYQAVSLQELSWLERFYQDALCFYLMKLMPLLIKRHQIRIHQYLLNSDLTFVEVTHHL